jgi:Na+-transporting NADH:ubiquinone oxidoreductase subunit NqrE
MINYFIVFSVSFALNIVRFVVVLIHVSNVIEMFITSYVTQFALSAFLFLRTCFCMILCGKWLILVFKYHYFNMTAYIAVLISCNYLIYVFSFVVYCRSGVPCWFDMCVLTYIKLR